MKLATIINSVVMVILSIVCVMNSLNIISAISISKAELNCISQLNQEIEELRKEFGGHDKTKG